MSTKFNSRGATGPQGARGEPSTSCQCEHFPIRETTRLIKERGSRSLSASDSTVIVDSDTPVKLILPNIESTLIECDDYYYTPCKIKIYVIKGDVTVLSSKPINGYTKYSQLEKMWTKYTFISHSEGWYLL